MNDLHAEMIAWRRDLHRHPEFGFEEHRTSAFVAAKLREFGLEVAAGIGGTGVVGTLRRGTGNRAIALRADMDALRIEERGEVAHKSATPGLMHACGHDGHTATLLGAAKLLAREGGFDGTLRFIFQPAEEWGRGALAMLADGLKERFPFDEIYGLHNMPGYPQGELWLRPGPAMAAEDVFEIAFTGVGGHASKPQAGAETLVAACTLVTTLQTIVSRRLDPAATAVVSVTQILTDGARNVLPGLARVLGDARSFDPAISAEVERQMRAIAEGVALAHHVKAQVTYAREFAPLINDPACTQELAEAGRAALGAQRVGIAPEPVTASEDFARLLEATPGCFAFLGAGDGPPLHNPAYDFNDALLIDGARVFATLARRRLPAGSLSC